MANMIYIQAVVIVVVAIFLERFISRYIKRVARRSEWPLHVANGVAFTFRLLILLGAVVLFLSVGGVPPDWLLSFTALGGAAIGFASTRTIGNFVAGIFVYITHP